MNEGTPKKEQHLPADQPGSGEGAFTPPPCTIVGIGASAGGQKALEQLFASLPPDSALAYVVVMHLPPGGPSFLADMLSRFTPMKVVTVENGMKPRANVVYVIPAGCYLTLAEGRFRLEMFSGQHGSFFPIDRFFHSLAEEKGNQSLAVILSGFGTDGSAGAKAIREAGGLVIVQSPETALHPAMPLSVISRTQALSLTPELIAAKIVEAARDAHELPSPCGQATTMDEDLATIFVAVKTQTGHDFSSYKKNTVIRRIERRMAMNGVAGMKKYIQLLQDSALEAQALGQEILIGVTSFFRDAQAFTILREEILPRIFTDCDPDRPIRIWHACCATGEEVYSTAILICEYLAQHQLHAQVQIFATDIDEAAIAFARTGTYNDDIEKDVSAERLKDFFIRVNGRWQVTKQLREMVVFAHHSLIKDPPFSRLDLLVCRNFLIYLNPDMQKRLVSLFHLVLKPKGVLFLGASETVGRHSDLFTPIDKKWKIYQRLDGNSRPDLSFPATVPIRRLASSPLPAGTSPIAPPSPAQIAEKLIMDRYAPFCVVVNENYEIVHVSTKANRLLEIPVGEWTRDLLKMVKEELRPALRAAIYKTFAEKKQIVFHNVRITGERGDETVNVLVEPLKHPDISENLALVILEPARPPQAPGGRNQEEEHRDGDEASREKLILQLEEQLRVTHEQLQAVTEQLETSQEGFMSSNEELMSINEEFQSANEELQSTNEELETSKEELQALNEELITVNAELQDKVEALDRANNDLENLFKSAGIATIFLDRELNIRRFSPAMARILNLIAADIGRPFRHLAGTIDWTGLPEDAHAVLASLTPVEREVAALEDHKFYLMRVLPYQTAEGNLDGIVVTLVDITARKLADEQIRNTALFPEENPCPVLRVKNDGILTFANRAAETELLPRWNCSTGEPVPESVRRELSAGLATGKPRELEIDCGRHHFSFALVPIAKGGYVNFYASDVTERKRAENALRESEERLKLFIEHAPASLAMFDRDMRYLSVSHRWLADYSLGDRDLIGQCHYEVFPEISEAWRQTHLRGLAGEVLRAEGDRFERADGSIQWIRWEIHPWRNADGTVGGIVIFTEDITERKLAQDALAESEARYRELVQNANSAIIRWSCDGTITFFNEYAQQFFGWNAEEAIGQPVGMLLPEQESTGADLTGLVRDIVAHPEDFTDHVNENICRDGRRVWMSWTNRAILDGKGQPREILAVGSDITKRKLTEEALQENEEQFRIMFLRSSVGKAQTDPTTGRFLRVNPALCRFTGFSEKELLQRTFADITHPDDREADEAEIGRLVQGEIEVFQKEKRYLRADGSHVWGYVTVNLVRDPQGHPLRTLAVIQDINERKQAEQARQESEEKFRSIIENVPLGLHMYELKKDGLHFVDTNPAAGRILGLDNSVYIGRTLEEAFPALVGTDIPEKYLEVAKHGGVFHNENIIYSDDRVSGAFETYCFRYAPGKIVTFFQEITERKRAEEQIRHNRKLLAEAEALSHTGAWEWDLASDQWSFSDEWLNIHGCNQKTLTADELLAIAHPDDRASISHAFEEARKGIALYDLEHRILRQNDGVVRIVQARGGFERNEKGKVVKAYGFTRDITESKRAEVRQHLLAETASQLLASETPQQVVDILCRKVMEFLDCQTFFNFLADDSRNCLHLNAFAGIPEEEAKRIEWLDYGVAVCGCAAQDACRIVAEDIPRSLDQRTELIKSYGIRAYACHPLMARGKVYGTLSFGTRTRDHFSDNDLMLMKAVADLVATAMLRKTTEEDLRQAKDAAETATRAKGQFLANMSHELRTPMTGVLGMLDLALGGELSDEQRGHLEIVKKSALALLRILNDILDFSRIEAGMMSFVEDPFELQETVRAATELFEMEARRKGMTLKVDIAADTPKRVKGDEGRIRQVLMNLVGNAVKFTERGEVSIRVEAGPADTDETREVVFTVTDSGIGIPAEKQQVLFRPFSQADSSHSRRFGGTGLGLAISREIVERLGGTIAFTSEPGQGSTFVVTLPLQETEATPKGTTGGGQSQLRVDGRRLRLLLAEDDPIIRKLLAHMLKLNGIDFDAAINGEEALTLWSQNEYDLILMDVQMPLMDGFEAARAIREREQGQNRHVPIVALTAHAFQSDEQRCLDAGMDTYLAKPINFPKLFNLIREQTGGGD